MTTYRIELNNLTACWQALELEQTDRPIGVFVERNDDDRAKSNDHAGSDEEGVLMFRHEMESAV